MLQNYKKGEVPQLCTAEEIIALAGYSTITSMRRAKEIYSKTLEQAEEASRAFNAQAEEATRAMQDYIERGERRQ